MRVFATSLLAAFFSVPLFAGPLEEIHQAFQGKNSFSVAFTQQVKEDFFPDQSNIARGHIQFTRPSSLIWKYEKPTERTIKYEKGNLTIEENGNVEHLTANDKMGIEESFSFLWGEASPKTLKIQNRSATSFRVLPAKPAKAAFQWIDVEVQKGKVVSARVKNKLEGESLIQFTDWNFKS